MNFYFESCSIIKLAILSLIAGFGEEAFFRGFLQSVISNNFGEFTGVLIANLIFGALHLITLTYGIIVFFIGCYLSAILNYTDSFIRSDVVSFVI
jgi:membrane protease YdiL (CAAX protease family)